MLISETHTFAGPDSIELNLHFIKLAERQEENGAGYRGSDSERTEQPGKLWLDVDSDKGKVECRRDGSLELGERRDDRFHPLGSLREGILERCDRSKYFGHADENVGA